MSRDLEDLGAVKVRVPGGDTVYASPSTSPTGRALGPAAAGDGRVGRRGRVLGQPGRAAHAARLRPRRRVRARPQRADGLLGTVAGDDTCCASPTKRSAATARANACATSAGIGIA